MFTAKRAACLINNFNLTFPAPVNTLHAAVPFRGGVFCCKDSWNCVLFTFDNVIVASNIIAVTAQYSNPTTIPQGATTSRCSPPILYIIPMHIKKIKGIGSLNRLDFARVFIPSEVLENSILDKTLRTP